ncbi:maleylpyruvate isomerase family mycothiol-dependent enzyme [Rothia sp. LK2588]|uniref:maleylpyruvate isomerase family mycothiol-dependent enzyme n=1 Tax=Rothia sp. LK2588 TaxID=3114369 RepID=UPI0034CE3268
MTNTQHTSDTSDALDNGTAHGIEVVAGTEAIAEARELLVQALLEAQPTDPTLCEGWQARHMVAHLVLRETSPLTAAGVLGGPLGARTERKTDELAQRLSDQRAYSEEIARFAGLRGYAQMRTRAPKIDQAMNLLEYVVHAEDVRRAQPGHERSQFSPEGRQQIWKALRAAARPLAGRDYPDGLVLESAGMTPVAHTVRAARDGAVATVLSGAPEELVLYLFGRTEVAEVKVQ